MLIRAMAARYAAKKLQAARLKGRAEGGEQVRRGRRRCLGSGTGGEGWCNVTAVTAAGVRCALRQCCEATSVSGLGLRNRKRVGELKAAVQKAA